MLPNNELTHKKFEPMLTRRTKDYSSSDSVTIVTWRHLVNDINLYRSPKSPNKQ